MLRNGVHLGYIGVHQGRLYNTMPRQDVYYKVRRSNGIHKGFISPRNRSQKVIG